MDDAAKRRALIDQFRDGRDLDDTHQIYHEDAILEFPQSGERFVGKRSFLEWRKQYPAKVDYRIRRITGQGDLWVLELLASYDGSPPMFGLGVMQFRGDKIARETIYVMEGFAPAAWRSEWVTMFDPLASVQADAWGDAAPAPIEADEALTAGAR